MVNFQLSEAQDPGFGHWHSLPKRKVAWPVSGTSSYVVVTNTYKPLNFVRWHYIYYTIWDLKRSYGLECFNKPE